MFAYEHIPNSLASIYIIDCQPLAPPGEEIAFGR